ncbi:nuclear transport factor 2 family protein [Coralloluteibacterium stylophorae]|uniref:Nuclear transport factor 2 family protein n=1 Tax=Coralloluteibacterium stylophorae TaxID=1776034 RepID=A0A8J7VQ86_9GAMM|nr:nuclear transport factor 2 family protein [Coralloluteibacterium stylophorae]
MRTLLYAVLLAASLVATPAASAAEPATEHNRRVVAAAFAAWAAGGSGFFDEVLAPDVVWTIAGSGPSAGTYRGREALLTGAVEPLTRHLATPVRPVSHRVWADGEHVVVDWQGEATTTAGRPYRNSYAWILRMEDGRAVEVKAYLDLAAYDAVVRPAP